MERKLNLQRFLPYRLSTLANKVSLLLARYYSDQFDLTIQEWRVLAVLGESSALSSVELVERTGMDKVTVSRAVKRLMGNNRIGKQQDGQDNRRFLLTLTPAGHDLFAEVAPIAMNFEDTLLAHLSGDEIEQMDDILNKLDAGVSRIDQL